VSQLSEGFVIEPSQAEVTVSELVRVVGKAMLLHLQQLVQQPGFSALWVAVLNSLAAAAAAGPEGLNDAAAAALQNLIIMLHEMVSPIKKEIWDHSWAKQWRKMSVKLCF
jgi:hypothetical protein